MSRDPIVAGTDGSPRAEFAVDKAGDLAEALGATVHVVCVPGEIEGKDWPARITAQQIVADAAERLRGRGVTVETHLPKGDASMALVEVAEQERAQMIVVGNKGMTGIGRVLGSLPNRVSHEAQCNVLIVPTKGQSLPKLRGGSIVVGTDGSSRGKGAVKVGTGLAKALEAELHIVSSAPPSGSAEAALAEAKAEAENEGVSLVTHTRDDDPADALRDVAEKNYAAIIVVGNKGMHAGEREHFGNVADKLSHTANASVLIVYGTEVSGQDDGAMSGVAGEGVATPGEPASA